MKAQTHSFTLGNYACFALCNDRRRIDVRTEFPQVPEAELLTALREYGYADFELEIGYNGLLIQRDKKNILIDAGTGQDQLVESLALAGLQPEEIDFLVLTHLDFDHVGGYHQFPKAQFILPQLSWDFWTIETGRQRLIAEFVQVFQERLEPDFLERAIAYRDSLGTTILPGLRERVTLAETGAEFLPGFRFHYQPGHRTDHFILEIENEDFRLLHVADSFRHCFQTQYPSWHSNYDSWPDQWTASLYGLVQRIQETDPLVFGAHLTFPGLARWTTKGLQLLPELG